MPDNSSVVGDGSNSITGSCHCGAVRWRFAGIPEAATACNCTICRRYGALWIYDFEDERISMTGSTKAYSRGSEIGFHFCCNCGCVVAWRALRLQKDGRRRIAVNLRLASEPDAVAGVIIDHFDGLNAFDDLPRDGRTVADMWF